MFSRSISFFASIEFIRDDTHHIGVRANVVETTARESRRRLSRPRARRLRARREDASPRRPSSLLSLPLSPSLYTRTISTRARLAMTCGCFPPFPGSGAPSGDVHARERPPDVPLCESSRVDGDERILRRRILPRERGRIRRRRVRRLLGTILANGLRSDGRSMTSGVTSIVRCVASAASTHASRAGGYSGYALRCPGRCATSRAMRSPPGAASRAASAALRCRRTSCVHAITRTPFTVNVPGLGAHATTTPAGASTDPSARRGLRKHGVVRRVARRGHQHHGRRVPRVRGRVQELLETVANAEREHLLERRLQGMRIVLAADRLVLGVDEGAEEDDDVRSRGRAVREHRVEGLVREVARARERPRGDRHGERAEGGGRDGGGGHGRGRRGDDTTRHQAVARRVLTLHAHNLPREEREAGEIAELETDAHAVGRRDGT